MAYDTWGGHWGTSWGLSWTRSSGPIPPVVVTDTGGSGNQSRGGRGSGRRDINNDPDAFSELLKEWRARRHPEPAKTAHVSHEAKFSPPTKSEAAPDDDTADELLEHVKRIEAAYDRSMAAYEVALAKVEQAKAVKVVKAKTAAKAKQAAIRQAAIEQEELARQEAMKLAIEWEQARLAYEDFLEDEEEIMLLS